MYTNSQLRLLTNDRLRKKSLITTNRGQTKAVDTEQRPTERGIQGLNTTQVEQCWIQAASTIILLAQNCSNNIIDTQDATETNRSLAECFITPSHYLV